MSDNANTHLTIDERRIIHTGIKNGSTKAAIAATIGKDKSTVGKEIKRHREVTYKCSLPLKCDNYMGCKHKRQCTPDCPDYKAFTCTRRDRSPGACDGCSDRPKCRMTKYGYNPEMAQKEYEECLVDSREGVDLTSSEAKALADVIGPLLKQGQSPYQIVTSHPELGICEKTLYNYIEGDIFGPSSGIGPMDLRRQVSRKLPKKKAATYKKREDRSFLKGRTYKDYLAYIEENPGAFVLQMDTVYNDVSCGPFIQTFKFVRTGLLFALLHDEKTAEAMTGGVLLLERILGRDLFQKHCGVILTDRGTEFSGAGAMEKRGDGTMRTRVYYCDPMQAGQKGSLENNHVELRYILPKETDLKALGLVSQQALNLAVSNVDSSPVESLCGKTPLELTEFLYPDLYKRLSDYGLMKIPSDMVVLKPYLLKQFLQ